MSDALLMLKVIKSDTPAGRRRFQKFIISFPRLKDSFKEGYRPYGFHLKGPFEGVPLSTVTLNANK